MVSVYHSSTGTRLSQQLAQPLAGPPEPTHLSREFSLRLRGAKEYLVCLSNRKDGKGTSGSGTVASRHSGDLGVALHARSGGHKSLATFSQIGLGQLGYQRGEERVSRTSRFVSHHLPFFFFVLVSLTKTAKKGLELKQNLIEEVRACSFYFSRPCI